MTTTGQPMRESALRLLVDALKIYSPSEKEGALAEMLSKRMSGELGFRDVRIDEAGNVIGEVGSGKLHLLLCGHMDTVPGELPVRLDDENIFGRGAADAKSPLCAMIMAASTLKTEGLRVTLAAVTREEGDSLGVRRVIERGGDYDFAVFGEPAGASKITIGYRGRMAVRVTVRTDGGHASSPWAHNSAVDESMRLLGRVREYERAHSAGDNEKKRNHYRSLSTCLTLIEGGTFSNVVPDVCNMTVDVRVPLGMECSRVQEDFMALIGAYTIENPSVKIETSFDEGTEPYESDSSSLLVRSFQRSIIKNLSDKPVFIHKTGTGDMNTLAGRMAIPTITYGPGDSRLEHTNHEAIAIRDYLRSIDVLRGVFDEIVALSASSNAAQTKDHNSG
jgi:LysW-gamma-L-lysine carboxypeptidase